MARARSARTSAAMVPAPTPKRGPGRPKKVEVPTVVATETPKKRGRPAKADAAPAAAKANVSKARVPAARGRPRKDATAAPTRSSPRAHKVAPAPAPAPASPRATKTRGRPKKTAPTAATVKPAPRVNARVRSKLRDRQQLLDAKLKNAAAEKARSEVPARRGVAKRGPGRPPKNAAVPAPTTARKVARDAVQKRARKGYRTLRFEVPEELAAEAQQHVLNMVAEHENKKAQDAREQEAQLEQDAAAHDTASEEPELEVQDGQDEMLFADAVEGADRSSGNVSIEDFNDQTVQEETSQEQTVNVQLGLSDADVGAEQQVQDQLEESYSTPEVSRFSDYQSPLVPMALI